MQREYIEQRNGGYYVAGTRVSLDSVVCAFKRGDAPDRILERYPLLGQPEGLWRDCVLLGSPSRDRCIPGGKRAGIQGVERPAAFKIESGPLGTSRTPHQPDA